MKKIKFAFLDVETTGLYPAGGDRIVEIGIIVTEGPREISRLSQLINPRCPIPLAAEQVHGISETDVANCPDFGSVAQGICQAMENAYIVGHNLRFDVGFVAAELAATDCNLTPSGCLDTCQLAQAMWVLPNYQLATVTSALSISIDRQHRALDDALASQKILNRVAEKLGGWDSVSLAKLQALHRYTVDWPVGRREELPAPLYDALVNGRQITIHYTSNTNEESTRTIRPETCYPVGKHIYIKAFCSQAGEMRTFRLDRMTLK